MLRPSKHAHPDRTVLNVALLLLSDLKHRRAESYDKLRHHIKDRVTGGEQLLLPALNLLYLLGLVDYQIKTDTIEYRGAHETV